MVVFTIVVEEVQPRLRSQLGVQTPRFMARASGRLSPPRAVSSLLVTLSYAIVHSIKRRAELAGLKQQRPFGRR